jgi:hypothetical protein
MDLKTYSEQKLVAFDRNIGKTAKFKPLKAQIDIFDAITNNPDVQIVQSRQVGVSTALATYIAHHLEYGVNNDTIYIISKRLEVGENLISSAKRIISGVDYNPWGYKSRIEMNGKVVEVVVGYVKQVLPSIKSGIIIVAHPEWYEDSTILFNEITCRKKYGCENLKLIVNGKVPMDCPINFKVVKIHWADSEMWTRERYVEVMRYYMTDEMDNLNPYITKGNPPKKGDSSTMDKTIQVRVDSRTYNNLALSAANADKSISEYVRKIISDSIAN